MNVENSIEIVSVTFGAGDSRLFAFTGEYFEVIDAPTPIDVVLSDFNGSQRARMGQASASFYSKGVKFGVIQITSSSAQTIRFAYGSGETGTRRSTGSVTVSGAVALDAATLLALEQINVRPEVQTGNFGILGGYIANTPETVFTPGANANGAILLSADVGMFDSTNTGIFGIFTFLSKASPPTTVVDGSVLLSSKIDNGFSTGLYQSGATLHAPQYIAPGQGLYFIGSIGINASGGNIRACRFKLL